MKEYDIEYLHKYLTNNTMKKMYNLDSYVLDNLTHNYVDVDLNIRYLIKYGITNIDKVVPNILEYLVYSNNDFIKKINDYEENMSKDDVISLIENM